MFVNLELCISYCTVFRSFGKHVDDICVDLLFKSGTYSHSSRSGNSVCYAAVILEAKSCRKLSRCALKLQYVYKCQTPKNVMCDEILLIITHKLQKD